MSNLVGTRYGADSQVCVIDEFYNKTNRKFCLVVCDKCNQDPELFPNAVYSIDKFSLLRGSIPCGCSKTYKWSVDQYRIRCTRKASELGYQFIGFNGDWAGHKTKIDLLCDKHGIWDTCNINHLINGRGCPKCKADKTREWNKENKRVPDEIMIKDFLASGVYHPDTLFWRDTVPNTSGHFINWKMFCPICCTESRPSAPKELKMGIMPCSCTSERQNIAYINLVEDDNLPIAIKFGITSDYDKRMLKQRKHCVYDIRLLGAYKFPDVLSCKDAEKECKRELICGVISRGEMSDGYTETVAIADLDKIIAIYTKHGGVGDESRD